MYATRNPLSDNMKPCYMTPSSFGFKAPALSPAEQEAATWRLDIAVTQGAITAGPVADAPTAPAAS
eukprot:CAMPEP_0206150076 /NCGR_PEP_ID=MMETSP1473-20131121/38112_1 /ASSEMBLY_ACC=CAM_ASM_001109 /TAXON_ID=1461547 /ORGANISM="Stichococcus sp, Strain RCC1054" /LENGTH=65 /DNA_ID=CAMNT_0053547565 /DNA_START=1104 /DNA_END=1299 /DNA_ORIENTATION=+